MGLKYNLFMGIIGIFFLFLYLNSNLSDISTSAVISKNSHNIYKTNAIKSEIKYTNNEIAQSVQEIIESKEEKEDFLEYYPSINLCGDVTGDGFVNILDSNAISNIDLKLAVIIGEIACADTNGDGIVSIVDAIMIPRIEAGLIQGNCRKPCFNEVEEEKLTIFSPSNELCGDVNGDGYVNVFDIGIIPKIESGLAMWDSEVKDLSCADTSGDGKVDISDTNMIGRIATGETKGICQAPCDNFASRFTPSENICGDIDGDKDIDDDDVYSLSLVNNGLGDWKEGTISLACVDANGDGIINSQDVDRVQDIVRKITSGKCMVPCYPDPLPSETRNDMFWHIEDSKVLPGAADVYVYFETHDREILDLAEPVHLGASPFGTGALFWMGYNVCVYDKLSNSVIEADEMFGFIFSTWWGRDGDYRHHVFPITFLSCGYKEQDISTLRIIYPSADSGAWNHILSNDLYSSNFGGYITKLPTKKSALPRKRVPFYYYIS